MICPNCGVELPADARFCIECGAQLPQSASTGATTVLPRYGSMAVACRACGAESPEGADYCVRCGRRLADAGLSAAPAPLHAPATPVAPAAPTFQRRARRRERGRYTGAFFLIGLGLLLLFKLPFWPLILVVFGLTAFLDAALRGRTAEAFASVFWLFGLAFLFSVPRLLVPGLIILVGLSILLKLGARRSRWP